MSMTTTTTPSWPQARWLAPSGGAPGRLSPREQQILDLVRSGRASKEIAFDLGIRDSTVRVLYARAMRKLGWTRRPRGGATR